MEQCYVILFLSQATKQIVLRIFTPFIHTGPMWNKLLQEQQKQGFWIQ